MSNYEKYLAFCKAENIPSMAHHEVGADDKTTINVGHQRAYMPGACHNKIGERVVPAVNASEREKL